MYTIAIKVENYLITHNKQRGYIRNTSSLNFIWRDSDKLERLRIINNILIMKRSNKNSKILVSIRIMMIIRMMKLIDSF